MKIRFFIKIFLRKILTEKKIAVVLLLLLLATLRAVYGDPAPLGERGGDPPRGNDPDPLPATG